MPPPSPAILLTVAAESQVWRRSTAVAGERMPAGRIHAVLGASTRTLCGLDHAELGSDFGEWLDEFAADRAERADGSDAAERADGSGAADREAAGAPSK